MKIVFLLWVTLARRVLFNCAKTRSRWRPCEVSAIVIEPSYSESTFFNSFVFRDLKAFKAKTDLIIANRLHSELADVGD